MKFTKEQIEKMATEYAEEQNDCYTNDFNGFVAGFERATELLFGLVITEKKVEEEYTIKSMVRKKEDLEINIFYKGENFKCLLDLGSLYDFCLEFKR